MTAQLPTLQTLSRILPPLAGTIASLGLITGIQSFFDPIGFATNFGLSISPATLPEPPYLQFIGARNLGSGLGILGLLAVGGQRKAVGLLLMTGTIAGALDGLLLWKEGERNGDKEGKGKAVGHVITAGLMALVGAGMFWLKGNA